MTALRVPLLILRVFLASLFAFLVLMQVMSIPGSISHDLSEAPEAGHVLWPILVVSELGMVCAQVVIVCIWRLLGMVQRDRIFSEASLTWVDVIVGAVLTAWVLVAALAAYLTAVIYLTPELRDPGIPIALFGIVLIGAVVVLLVVVLRALLRQATALRTDLEGVI